MSIELAVWQMVILERITNWRRYRWRFGGYNEGRKVR
jgi:hypothetical protein